MQKYIRWIRQAHRNQAPYPQGFGPIPLSKGGQGVVILVIVLAVLIGGGSLAWKFKQNYRVFDKGGIPYSEVQEQGVSATSDWKTYSYKDYSFNYPSSWNPEENNAGADFVANNKVVATLECPIREVGYQAWNMQSEERKITAEGVDYPIELWNLTDKDKQNNPLGDFSLILINRDNFAQSCEISVSAGPQYSPEIAREIYKSILISN